MTGFLLAEFDDQKEAAEAARAAAEAKRPPLDVLSHSPIDGIAEYLAPPRIFAPIGWVMFIAGASGASLGYLMQWYSAAVAYPTNSGGRPLNSWPAFLLVPYEMSILFAAVIGILAWMWMCGLPKLFHPLFAADLTGRAVQDSYVLIFPRDAPLARWIKTHLKPKALHEIE